MSKTETVKHTRGPWRIVQCLPPAPEYYGQTVTVIVDANNRNVLNRDLLEEAANARLLAAAPELLEACEAALARLEEDYETHLALCAPEPADDLPMPQLRAAIAKATKH